MNIIQINTVVNSGSTGRIAEEIGIAMIENGHKSAIAFGRGERPSQSKKIRIGNKWNVYSHVLQTRLLDNHGFASKAATQKLIDEIEAYQPDVIGLHNLHGYYLHVGVLFDYLKNKGIPVVWTFHDCWPFTGHCSYFDAINCEKWKTECNNCPLTQAYPSSWFMDNSKENFHNKKDLFQGLENLTIVTPSKWLKGLVKQSFLKDYPVKVINNGIDLERFKPVDAEGVKDKYSLSGYDIVLGVASIWDRRKGLDHFIQLAKLMEDDVRIVLVGLSKKQIQSLPINIIGVERTESIEELAALYSSADVFVNPTLVDNFPTTNLEALACGTPVITYDTGGSPEAVDEDTGIVVEKGDIGKLHSAVNKILNNGKQYYESNCRKRAVQKYDKKERYQDYLKLYENILRPHY